MQEDPGGRRRATVVVYLIFLLSGVAGLGYQIVWTRMFSTGLGHEMPSMLAVVAAFFGGLAIGSAVLDRRVSVSAVPGRWYAGLEVGIAAWAIVTIALIPLANTAAARLIGVDAGPWRHWAVSFVVPFVVLLPATAAMGATFPAMERLVARLRGGGRRVAGVYAVNTLGAMTGTLVTTFLIVPAVGYARTVTVLVIVNLICAIAIFAGPARGEAARPPVHAPFVDQPTRWRLLLTIFVTGLLGVGYEVLGVRVMAQALENTVFTFATALMVYLFGTALGAALYARFFRRDECQPALVTLLCFVAVGILAGILAMNRSINVYAETRVALGGGELGSLVAELFLAALVFFAPTLAMGALFSHLVQAARRTGGGVGLAMGLNTLGAALAPAVFGVVLLPWLGSLGAVLVCAGSYLLLLPWSAVRARRLLPLALALPMLPFVPGNLLLVVPPEGMRVTESREGVRAAVTVLETPQGERLLKVNNRFFMGGLVGSFADRRQAHIPLLLHPAPRRALFLGVGTGMTMGAAAEHDEIDVRGVELLPDVVDFLPRFEPGNNYETLGRDAYVVADARRYVRASETAYDVIVADLFHPARDGSGALYTVEHFRAVRDRLADGGLFCQWLPLYQLDEAGMRMIVRTFLEVFPDATAVLAHYNIETPMVGLIGGRDLPDDPDWFAARGMSETLRAALESVALTREIDLFGCVLASAPALRAYAGEGPLNTDDHPRVIFAAPSYVYRALPPADVRLRTILAAEASADVRAETGAFGPAGRAQRRARDLYLDALVAHRDGRAKDLDRLLVESLAATPTFRTAYIAGLQFAIERSHGDPNGAARLLRALRDARPEEAGAGEMLRRLRR